MGENVGFKTRNDSIVNLILTAGGVFISLTTPDNSQTMQPPFAVSTIGFHATAGTADPGSGEFITKDSIGNGAGLVYGPGSLSSAPTGSILVVFDVNFLESGANAESQALTKNMIAY